MSERRGLFLAGAATTLAVALFATLGTWQVRRMHWKHRLIATVTERASGTAMDAPGRADPLASDGEAIDWRKVRIEGRFLAGREARVQALVGEPRGRYGGPGIWAMSPLERPDGEIVWINRGFVPIEKIGAESPIDPASTVWIEGLARRAEPRGVFTPADEPAKNLWFVRDPARLSAAFGLAAERTLPYTIDAGVGATPASGLPQAGETRLTFTDNHLGYALTWYGLALAAAGVFVVRARAERRRGAAGSAAP
ncbi:MAG: SURF1 family protein [Hyphomicrobiales bacterium]|nr:SURF1 family protein [Hyphomicrobiales bacterium]